MAKVIVKPFKLSDEDKKKIEGLSSDLEKAKAASNALKALGEDTKSLDDRIALAEMQRDTLLKEFG